MGGGGPEGGGGGYGCRRESMMTRDAARHAAVRARARQGRGAGARGRNRPGVGVEQQRRRRQRRGSSSAGAPRVAWACQRRGRGRGSRTVGREVLERGGCSPTSGGGGMTGRRALFSPARALLVLRRAGEEEDREMEPEVCCPPRRELTFAPSTVGRRSWHLRDHTGTRTHTSHPLLHLTPCRLARLVLAATRRRCQ